MKITPEFRKKLSSLLNAQQGVVTKDDLWTIISPSSEVDFYRQLKKLIQEMMIFKILRGYYVGPKFSKAALIMTIRPQAYLSLEYALAYYNLIGTYAQNKIRPIVSISTKNIECPQIIIEYKKIKEDKMFGFEVKDGIKLATKEKAFLDTLYLYQKGTKFYFDIYSDIDISQLDRGTIFKYLKKYKNPKFIKFVKDYFND
ncbi:MAG: hypothetical protein ISR65_17140 [Bacteriovoracaceae bacterium]|nr:hypothetical protein [Bacteriovoracaceae bacterium]